MKAHILDHLVAEAKALGVTEVTFDPGLQITEGDLWYLITRIWASRIVYENISVHLNHDLRFTVTDQTDQTI